MLFSYNWLKEYTQTKLPAPDKLADIMSLHAFEVEGTQKTKGDTVLDIDVLPNRAHDCLNHTGMAREIAAIQGSSVAFPKTQAIAAKKGSLSRLKVQIESSALVPRYAAIVVENIQIGASPKKVQQYLESVGVNSINNIVDLTNFIMLELGQPLHAFDYDQIQGQLLRVRAAKAAETLETLDKKQFALPQGALVIEDANRLIDVAGIKGGKNSGISSNTKNIVLQAANFNPSTIYQTKKILKFTTQAADMYANGIDPNLGMQALERANVLLQEWGIGGNIIQVVDVYPKKAKPTYVRLELAYAESLLGIPIPKQTAKNILVSLGCAVTDLPTGSQKTSAGFRVEIPTRRLDITIPEDLIEEIGRIYGYEHIPSQLPIAPVASSNKNLQLQWQEIIRDTMKQLGFTESYSYSFIGQKDMQLFSYTPQAQENLIELENPISEDFCYMRDSLLENLLKHVQANYKKFDGVRLFEIGNVFSKRHKKFEETAMLGSVLHNATFYHAKGIVDFIFQNLGIHDIWYDEYQTAAEKNPRNQQASRTELWHSGTLAEIKVGSEGFGFIGEISSAVTSKLKIQKSVAAVHLNIEKLAEAASQEHEYQPASKFPSIMRDVAVLVPIGTKVIELLNSMNGIGKNFIYDIDVFDMYTGGSIPEGKKSIAFHVMYQSSEKTLTHKEVDDIHTRIIVALEENPLWEVRK